MLRILKTAPKFAVTALIVLAIVNLLVGVILRYFVGAITDWLDVDPVPFTWVEEVGELSLAWLTLIGAAVGIQSPPPFSPPGVGACPPGGGAGPAHPSY